MQLLLHVPIEILYNPEQGQNDENVHCNTHSVYPFLKNV